MTPVAHLPVSPPILLLQPCLPSSLEMNGNCGRQWPVSAATSVLLFELVAVASLGSPPPERLFPALGTKSTRLYQQ